MFSKKELKKTILYSKLKVRDIAKKEEKTNKDILNLCILNLLGEVAEKELEEFDD